MDKITLLYNNRLISWLNSKEDGLMFNKCEFPEFCEDYGELGMLNYREEKAGRKYD